jgi:hypothetical protein
MKSAVYDYIKISDISWMPLLPIRLESTDNHFEVAALVDSGAGINVLPYAIGLYLGLRWDDYKRGPNLTGNADDEETRLITLECLIPNFGKLDLGFAWTNGKQQRVILGQQNFFSIFDVCFVKRQLKFTVMQPEKEQA